MKKYAATTENSSKCNLSLLLLEVGAKRRFSWESTGHAFICLQIFSTPFTSSFDFLQLLLKLYG